MTPVFGHGRLRLYLLRLLDESPRHGYEIMQQLKQRFAGLYVPSAGTIYPRLARLESEGLVRHELQSGRKVYFITDAGRAELAAKTGELGELDAEIHNSVRDLADGIADEVRETARTVTEDLAAAARAARQAGGSAPGSGPFPFPFPQTFPFIPPQDSGQWSKEQWREWKHQQREQMRGWREDWRRTQREHRGHTHSDRQAWKEQWAQQWRDQWAEQAKQWSTAQGTWAWWSGSDAEPGNTDTGNDWRELWNYVRREGGALALAARRHGPLTAAQTQQAREVVDRALAELHRILEPQDRVPGPDEPADPDV
jgi:DNA-binding PadR family transcriptional regulator